MALQIKSGQISVTANGTINVMDVGFEPDVVLFFNRRSALDETLASVVYSFGVAAGGNQWCMGVYLSVGSLSLRYRTLRNNLVAIRTGNNSTTNSVAFTQTTAQGFDLSISGWTSDSWLDYVAIKGGQWNCGTQLMSGTAVNTVRGVGFEPDGVIMGTTNDTSINSLGNLARYYLGYSDKSFNQRAIGFSNDASAQCKSRNDPSAVMMHIIRTDGSVYYKAVVDGWDVDGFNFTVENNFPAYYFGWIAFKGVQVEVGDFTRQFGTGNQAVSTSFEPEVLMMISPDLDYNISSSKVAFGFGVTEINGNTFQFLNGNSSGAVVNQTGTSIDTYWSTQFGSTETKSRGTLGGFTPSGFNIDWSVTDADYPYQINYLVIADAGGAGARPNPLFFGQDF